MTETPLWLIWPSNPAASLVTWGVAAVLWAAFARNAMRAFARHLQQWNHELVRTGERALSGRIDAIRQGSLQRERSLALRRLQDDVTHRRKRLIWLSEEEGARLRAATTSLDKVVQEAEGALAPDRSSGQGVPANRPERSDIITALLGWRRIVRLQGDIGRSLQRLEQAQSAVLSDDATLESFDQPTETRPGHPGVPASLIRDVVQWLLFFSVIAANGWLLFPGIQSLGVPGPTLNGVVFVALVLAQVITALTCWQTTGRWMTVLSLILMTAWSVVLGMMAHLSLPQTPATGAAIVRVTLGALVPFWILLAVRWLPDLLSVVTRLIEWMVTGLLTGVQVLLILWRAAVALLCHFWILLVEVVAAPVIGPVQLFRPSGPKTPDSEESA